MGMDEEPEGSAHSLDAGELDTLLKLYSSGTAVIKGLSGSGFDDKVLHDLIGKNLISISLDSGMGVVSLTDMGASICGSVMMDRVQGKADDFRDRVSMLPGRGVGCLVNRVMWDDSKGPWFERVLLMDPRMQRLMKEFLGVVDSLGLSWDMGKDRWFSPEVKQFLHDEFRSIPGLSPVEEECLKKFFFFHVYAQDQRNLIVFDRDGQEFRSMLFEDNDSFTSGRWNLMNRLDPKTLLSELGLDQEQVLGLLFDMQNMGFVTEHRNRFTNPFFGDEGQIFVVKDSIGYMGFIYERFLSPVVDSILRTD
jgi:hypothetical protein